MTEDLENTKYNDGTPVHLLTDSERNCMFYDIYCTGYTGPYYINSLTSLRGLAYDFSAVYSGKLCPTGWRVPSNEEMTTLVDYLGGSDIAGGKLKETGISHWQAPNTGAANESGFSAIPAFSNKPVLDNDGTTVNYWSVDYISGTGGQLWTLVNNSGEISRSGNTLSNQAFTVRCIKN